ncbi:hypothetical protein LPB140_05220 [Sphingorhabdus lutea]|uniref:DUF692 domain-containing protein n=1 Tax=Sphingorhabdus lutea TaxID=1913578 RepID=A0A1L3JES2_9SPHN|nr:DUF692 domain-containing protein [Sphingorhabdus lutea]APG63599.1 hypothetical protein LPB140_05220 [Sphingorhabdus lutea]
MESKLTNPAPLPHDVGIGLKPDHYDNLLQHSSESNKVIYSPAWVELHPQNYIGPHGIWGGGPSHNWLAAIAEIYPLSFHSVALSLGSPDGVDREELRRLKQICARYSPASVSDHLSFSGNAHDRFADLLPIPYTAEMLTHFAAQVDIVQHELGRKILIENPSRYLAFTHDEMDETTFMDILCQLSGCGMILDINNVDVSCKNLGLSAYEYLGQINPEHVGEIHLAGHFVEHHDSGPLLIDDHGRAPNDDCWDLFSYYLSKSPPCPILIEWDNNIPQYDILMDEVKKARRIIEQAVNKQQAGQNG